MSNKKIIFSIILIIIFVISFVYFINRSNENAAINLYKEIIDLTVLENSGLSQNAEYISLDTTKLVDPLNDKKLSDNSIDKLVKYCEKYSDKVYEKNYQELVNDGLGDNTSLKGYLISITLTSKSFNNGTINSKIYKGNQGSSMTKYNIKYNNNSWIYEESGEKVQSMTKYDNSFKTSTNFDKIMPYCGV
jgi:hypothetical protein